MKFVITQIISFILIFHTTLSFASEPSQTLAEREKPSKLYNKKAVGVWDCNHILRIQNQAIIQVKKDKKGVTLQINNKTIKYEQNDIQRSDKTISAHNSENVDHITFDYQLKLLSYLSMPEVDVDINKYDHYLCSRRK